MTNKILESSVKKKIARETIYILISWTLTCHRSAHHAWPHDVSRNLHSKFTLFCIQHQIKAACSKPWQFAQNQAFAHTPQVICLCVRRSFHQNVNLRLEKNKYRSFHPTTSCPKLELGHTELTDESAPKAIKKTTKDIFHFSGHAQTCSTNVIDQRTRGIGSEPFFPKKNVFHIKMNCLVTFFLFVCFFFGGRGGGGAGECLHFIVNKK